MAVKFGKALGLEVTVISTSEGKRKTALELGAAHFLVSKDEKSMQVMPTCSKSLMSMGIVNGMFVLTQAFDF